MGVTIRRRAKSSNAPTHYPITGGPQVFSTTFTASDGTRYEQAGATGTNTTIRRNPRKPYRNKAERKVWKAARQRVAGVRS